MQWTIGTHSFASKRDAMIAVRKVLNTAELDQHLAGDDADLIAAIYAMHPRKTTQPVAAFCVSTNNFRGALSRGFQAITTDDKIPWSYLPSFNPDLAEPSLIKVMRDATMLLQREALHLAYAGRAIVPCSNCRAGLTIANANVHHLHPKFRDIAEAFIALVGIPAIQTNRIGDDFCDEKIKQRWLLFHESVANRAILCRACNAADERTRSE